MKQNQFVHSRQSDALVINNDTVHQYYNTVQSDLPDDQLLDRALDRRRDRSRADRRQQQWLGTALAAVSVAALALVATVWLL